jgi:hypothetical protein
MSHIPLNLKNCGDCGVEQGQLHVLGCDMEYCTHDEQLITCQVCWPEHPKRPRCKRFRYIEYALLCGRCGTQDPAFFMVDDRIWTHYVHPAHSSDVLCKPCFDFIVTVIPLPPERKPRKTTPLPADPNQPALI